MACDYWRVGNFIRGADDYRRRSVIWNRGYLTRQIWFQKSCDEKWPVDKLNFWLLEYGMLTALAGRVLALSLTEY